MLRDRSVFQETLTETENAADVEIFLVKSRKSRKVFNSTSKKHPHKFSIIHSPIPVLKIHNLDKCVTWKVHVFMCMDPNLCAALWNCGSYTFHQIQHRGQFQLWLSVINSPGSFGSNCEMIFLQKKCLNWKKEKIASPHQLPPWTPRFRLGPAMNRAFLSPDIIMIMIVIMMVTQRIPTITKSHHGGKISVMIKVGKCQWQNPTIHEKYY